MLNTREIVNVRSTRKVATFALLLVTLFLLSSCSVGSKPTRFYSIASLAETASHPRPNLRIGIGPVQIPRLLRHPQIVTRKHQTEIALVEEHQWGGSLREDLINAFSDNLSTLLGTENVEGYPWKNTFKPNYQVRINIEQLDGSLNGNVTLKARWRLLQNGKVLMVKHPRIQVPVEANNYNAYVRAQSEAVYRLSKRIVSNIR